MRMGKNWGFLGFGSFAVHESSIKVKSETFLSQNLHFLISWYVAISSTQSPISLNSYQTKDCKLQEI